QGGCRPVRQVSLPESGKNRSLYARRGRDAGWGQCSSRNRAEVRSRIEQKKRRRVVEDGFGATVPQNRACERACPNLQGPPGTRGEYCFPGPGTIGHG